jgi:hypothetical protein
MNADKTLMLHKNTRNTRPKEFIFAASQFQKSPLRPPFLKGGWGDFRGKFA